MDGTPALSQVLSFSIGSLALVAYGAAIGG